MTLAESSQVRWGQRTIKYAIRRSSRRRTVAVSVDGAEGVVLTAPQDVSVGKLDAVVRDRASWIVGKLRHVDQQATQRSDREWISGESIMYLGRHYRLRVQARVHPQPARVERGRLVVQVSRDETLKDRPTAVRESVVAWYRDHAENRLTERVSHWAPIVGVDEPPIVVPARAPAKRWGSCDRGGTLRFSWRVIQAPMRLVDYVVAHELVHLVHRDHTDAFWSRLEDAMPDYDARREALRRLGAEMEW